MKLDTKKYIPAIIVAPLTAGPGWIITNLGSNFDFIDMLSVIIFITGVAYMVAFFVVFTFGSLVYALLKYLKALNFFTLSFAGLPLGYLTAVLMGSKFIPLTTGCISGLLVSTTMSLVMLKKNK